MPAHLYSNTYAICELDVGEIEIGQVPGHPPQVKGDFSNLVSSKSFRFAIKTYGKMGASCDQGGAEFNPLAEFVQYGTPNPHQDPTRGRLDGFESDSYGDGSFQQAKLLQNLGGKDSIIGKMIIMVQVKDESDSYDTDTVIDCCVIGQAPAPEGTPPAPTYHQPHQNHYRQPHQQVYQAPQQYGRYGW